MYAQYSLRADKSNSQCVLGQRTGVRRTAINAVAISGNSMYWGFAGPYAGSQLMVDSFTQGNQPQITLTRDILGDAIDGPIIFTVSGNTPGVIVIESWE